MKFALEILTLISTVIAANLKRSSITSDTGELSLAYLCLENHRAKNCNLCARAFHHQLSTNTRRICFSLIYGCSGGCQFKTNPTLMFSQSPSEKCIETKCGKTATVKDLDRAVSSILPTRSEQFGSASAAKTMSQAYVESTLGKLQDELYRTIEAEKCRSSLVQNHIYMGEIDQTLTDDTCQGHHFFNGLPTIAFFACSLMLSIGVVLTYKAKGRNLNFCYKYKI